MARAIRAIDTILQKNRQNKLAGGMGYSRTDMQDSMTSALEAEYTTDFSRRSQARSDENSKNQLAIARQNANTQSTAAANQYAIAAGTLDFTKQQYKDKQLTESIKAISEAISSMSTYEGNKSSPAVSGPSVMGSMGKSSTDLLGEKYTDSRESGTAVSSNRSGAGQYIDIGVKTLSSILSWAGLGKEVAAGNIIYSLSKTEAGKAVVDGMKEFFGTTVPNLWKGILGINDVDLSWAMPDTTYWEGDSESAMYGGPYDSYDTPDTGYWEGDTESGMYGGAYDYGDTGWEGDTESGMYGGAYD